MRFDKNSKVVKRIVTLLTGPWGYYLKMKSYLKIVVSICWCSYRMQYRVHVLCLF